MKTIIVVSSLTLAWAQAQSGAVRPRLIAVASHTVLSPSDVAKAAATLESAAKAAAGKPATSTPASIESAADRILRRLDETFPYKKPGATRPAETRPAATKRAGTRPDVRASSRATPAARISLHWPDEIAPRALIR